MFIFGAFMVLSVDTINFVTEGLITSLATFDLIDFSGRFHLPLSGSYYRGWRTLSDSSVSWGLRWHSSIER